MIEKHKQMLRADWAVVGMMLLYAAYVSTYSVQKHWACRPNVHAILLGW